MLQASDVDNNDMLGDGGDGDDDDDDGWWSNWEQDIAEERAHSRNEQYRASTAPSAEDLQQQELWHMQLPVRAICAASRIYSKRIMYPALPCCP